MTSLRKISRSLFEKYWPYVILLLIVSGFFWKFFLQGKIPIPGDFVIGVYFPWLDYKWGYQVGVPVKNPITSDVVSLIYPMQMLAVNLLKKGLIPLWNPYILTGTPLFANFQSTPFSPTNFLYFIFDKFTAWGLQIFLQHILAAFFTYLLLRNWKLSKMSAVFGGMVFALSGFNIIYSQWNGHVLTASFIPLSLLFVDKFLDRRSWQSGFGISFTIFLQIISGYPQLLFYNLIAILLLVIIRAQASSKYFITTLLLGLYLVLGLGLSSFQILPGLELVQNSQRQVETIDFNKAFLPWAKIITFIAPDFFGNPSTRNYWGPGDYTSTTGFVGVITLIFSSIGITLIKKEKEVKYVLILLIITLIISLPNPVSFFIRNVNFLGSQAASADRALILFNLSLAVLAAFGYEKWFYIGRKKFLYHILPTAFLLAIFAFYSYLSYQKVNFWNILEIYTPEKWMSLVALKNLVFPTVILLTAVLLFLTSSISNRIKLAVSPLFFVLLIIEIFRFGWKFTPFLSRNLIFPTTPVINFLQSQKRPFRVSAKDVIPMNFGTPYGIEFLEGYEAVYPINIGKFIAVANSFNYDASPQGKYGSVSNETSRLLNLANVKYILTLKKDSNGNPSQNGNISSNFLFDKYKRVFEDKTVVILENKEVLPRAFMSYDWQTEASNDILKNLVKPSYNFKNKILLSDNLNEKSVGIDENPIVDYQIYDENESKILVSTTKPGLLFLSDQYYPGWKVYVDGIQNNILRADYAFRAVYLTEGKHSVVFVYKPESFYNGLIISLISFIMLVSVSLYQLIVGKNSKTNYTTREKTSNTGFFN